MWTLGSTAGEEKRAGNCCQSLLRGSSLPFSPLLRLSPEFSHAIQESRDSKLDLSWKYIKRSQTHECGKWDWGHAIPFLGKHKCNFPCSVGNSAKDREHLLFAQYVQQLLGNSSKGREQLFFAQYIQQCWETVLREGNNYFCTIFATNVGKLCQGVGKELFFAEYQ